jgi:hypothetical protein
MAPDVLLEAVQLIAEDWVVAAVRMIAGRVAAAE